MIYRTIFIATVLIGCGENDKTTVDAPPSSNPDGAGPNSDAATTDGAPVDAPVVTADAAVGVTCGTMTCTGTQECCAGTGGSTCVAQGTCQTATFTCDGPEDCPGQVCCFGGGPGGGGSECRAANQCQNNACHENTDCEGTTPMCCAIGSTPYEVCLAQCPP